MLYEVTVPQFTQMLKNLSALLDKAGSFAESRKFDVKNLLEARLAPDQFHLIRQVQIACDSAKGVSARLAGQEPPKHEDNEQTLPELKARVQKTIDFLGTLKADQFKDAESRMIPIGFMPGKALPAREFTMRMAIPNFFFHVTVAYEILRHNGVGIGKNDFLGPIEYRNL